MLASSFLALSLGLAGVVNGQYSSYASNYNASSSETPCSTDMSVTASSASSALSASAISVNTVSPTISYASNTQSTSAPSVGSISSGVSSGGSSSTAGAASGSQSSGGASSSASASSASSGTASSTNGASSTTYTNPILNGGADPWVIRSGDYYYMTYSLNTNITLFRSKVLTDWSNAESKLLFNPSYGYNYSTDLWAPEIHNINGLWYVIFTGDPNYDTPPPSVDMYCTYHCPAVYHRMFVLESSGSDIWTSSYSIKSELNTYDQFAIDGTYFQHTTGLYHIYSCWYRAYDGWPANLCITKMENPYTVSSNFTERTILSVPDNAWEKTPFGRPWNQYLSSNEGPEQLVNPNTGQNFVIYSGARSDNQNYCLGQLELVGEDPTNAEDWRKNNEGCVFYQNKLTNVYGVGHASFTTSPDGSQNWIVYHGMLDPITGWAARSIRAQQFTWNADGTPNFPRPGYGPYPVPAGQS